MAKLSVIPRVIPKGLFFPPCVEADKMIGSRGHIHGASMVKKPDMKVKNDRTST
jgi:hypothetical protein